MPETERDDSDRDEMDALAGEYVLGTLDAEERRAAEARLESDAAFHAAVAAWETRLQPLADGLAEIDPPKDLLDRIVARIDPPQVLTSENRVDALCRSLRRWRIAAGVAASAALFLASTLVIDRFIGPETPAEFVAVLTSEGAAPQFVASVNFEEGTISLRRLGRPPPPDRSYELWAVAPGAAPESLGLLNEASISRPLDRPLTNDLTLAVSLEPEGGSPTGAPTGPVVFSGSLVATE